MSDNMMNLLSRIGGTDGVTGAAVVDNRDKSIYLSVGFLDDYGYLTTAVSEMMRSTLKMLKLSNSEDKLDDILVAFNNRSIIVKSFPGDVRYCIVVEAIRDANVALIRLKLKDLVLAGI